VNKTDSI